MQCVWEGRTQNIQQVLVGSPLRLLDPSLPSRRLPTLGTGPEHHASVTCRGPGDWCWATSADGRRGWLPVSVEFGGLESLTKTDTLINPKSTAPSQAFIHSIYAPRYRPLAVILWAGQLMHEEAPPSSPSVELGISQHHLPSLALLSIISLAMRWWFTGARARTNQHR